MSDDDYDREFMPGNIKSAVRETGSKPNSMFMVPVDSLVVDERFNVRIADAKREEAIEKLVDSIIVNGYLRHNPMSGFASIVDGKNVIVLTGGFTRYEAVKRCIARGYPIKDVPVVLKPAGTNMIDLTVALDVDNKQTPLRPYERAKVVKRLIGFGLTEREIALRLGVTVVYVGNLLYLISLPAQLRQLVIDDVVSAAYAVEKARELGAEQAYELLKQDAGPETDTGPELVDEGPRERPPQEPPMPRRPGRRPGSITAKEALFALDHGLELGNGQGLTWLRNWREREEDTVAEFDTLLKASRARKPPAAPEPEPLQPPTEDEVRHNAEVEMIAEGRRLDRIIGTAPQGDDEV